MQGRRNQSELNLGERQDTDPGQVTYRLQCKHRDEQSFTLTFTSMGNLE